MESLVKALPWIAQGVARSCGVKVRFDQRATTASLSRDGVITLPTIPVGDETASTLALGYIVHEAAGHRCFSDFEVLDQAVGGPEETLFRIIEDCRIERAVHIPGPTDHRVHPTVINQFTDMSTESSAVIGLSEDMIIRTGNVPSVTTS